MNQSKKCLILLSFLFSTAPVFGENPSIELKKLAGELNQRLENPSFSNRCPGLSLVLSCGNFVCEKVKGENEQNCPADCIQASIRSYNQQTLCEEVKQVFTPTTELEVQGIVRNALANHQKVKAVGNAHSANQILCSNGVVIATEKLNRVIGIEQFEGDETVRLEPGVTLAGLTDWLDAKGKSVGYAVMGFNGVSIAGAISTGSHGSSVNHDTVLANAVKSLNVVGADGKLHHYSERTTDQKSWRALKTSFGLLGIITEIRLKVIPQKNLEVNVTYGSESDFTQTGDVFSLVKECDWGQINWFPGAQSYMKSCGKVTNKPAQKEATNRLVDPSFPGLLVKPIKQVMQYAACEPAVACLLDRMRSLQMKVSPPFQYRNENGKVVSAKNLVGPSHHLMTSKLTPLQSGFFQMDWEIAVPKSRALEALKAVKEHIVKNNICLPLVGVFLRFAPSLDDTLMAHTVSGGAFVKNEPVVFIEMPVYLPADFSPSQKQDYDRAYEEFAKLLIEKFDGRAHWGKNRDWVFDLHRARGTYGKNAKDFAEVMKRMDPEGVFSNSFSQNFVPALSSEIP